MAWQLAMLVLCAYVLVILFLQTIITPTPHEARLFAISDNIVCAIFLADFFYQLYTAPNKWRYLRWGWLDLISSIPYLPFMRFARIGQLFRILRLLRAARSAKILITYFFHNRAQSTFTAVAAISFVLVFVSSIAMLNVETAPNSNIKTAEDALWWAMVTVTTVGYGDVYPVTDAGRAIAVCLMIAGVGLFGTFTAYVATRFFLPSGKTSDEINQDLLNELRAITARIAKLERKLEAPTATHAPTLPPP